MSWTDERVEKLKKMWADGQAASAIAKELGGVTRNAVIGKAHRLGLSNRAGGTTDDADKEKKTPENAAPSGADTGKTPDASAETIDLSVMVSRHPPATATASPRKPIVPAGQPLPPQPSTNEISPEAIAKVTEVEKQARKISLMELSERTCKWPIGDPATEDFYFCGLPVQQGKPYCEAHANVGFQPMSTRRDRRR